MRLLLISTAAACALLTACNSSDDDAIGNTAANSAAVLPINDSAAATANAVTVALPTEPMAKDRAAAFMHDRHEKYEELGDAMKAVSRELKGKSPDLAVVRKNAGVIATFAPQIPSLFPPGTGPEVGKTEAKAAIWQKSEDFVAKSKDFTAAALAFDAAAKGSDLAAIRAAHGTMGKTCKACHDLYREEH
ncbi:cytochrome c [Sphingomonas sp.]|uniref:c-type cytochrome n=1 Tax=Sphingomonas sp. TaxID=28214 RepID=UPI00286EAE7E|nr:cytochrome c [Sphingomonas sp.]